VVINSTSIVKDFNIRNESFWAGQKNELGRKSGYKGKLHDSLQRPLPSHQKRRIIHQLMKMQIWRNSKDEPELILLLG
jgi:hypothetical protein